MRRRYSEIVEILKISQERRERDERFRVFEEAVSFYKRTKPFSFPADGRGVFLIAGTNGKGSVAKTLETLIAASGQSVGLYTSPHLIEPTERIRSGERDLTPDEMELAFELIEPTIEKFQLSHFEILTLMMIEVFFGGRLRPVVEFAVIEVGVGGRLDPTRVIPRETAALVSVGYDHEALLGSTLTSIAREKVAIAEGAKRFVYLPPASQEVRDVIDDATARFHSVEFVEARIFESRIEKTHGKPNWEIQTPWGAERLTLLGERAIENTSLALEILHQTGFELKKLLPALSTVRWPGRMQKVSFRGRELFLSGDHNEQGVASLAKLLRSFDYATCFIVVGVGSGKPLESMLKRYREIPRVKLFLTRTSFRAMKPDEMLRWKNSVEQVIDDPVQAIEEVTKRAHADDLIVVSGSLYLVGDLLSLKIFESARSHAFAIR